MFLKRVDSIIQNYLMKFRFLSVLSMRIILGTAFIIHGKSKFPLPPQKLMEYFGFSPFFASFIALSEVLAGLMLIISFFLKSFIGNLITRVSALTIVVIMISAFYLAHKDWFINEKLFTSEQIFLFVVGIYFLVNGNEDFKKKVFKN